MQFYSAKLRLSGSPLNEVRDVYSAPEILLMQFLHGKDAVTEVKPVKTESMNLREYKEVLKAKYNPSLIRKEQSIDKIFGALAQLPVVLPDDLLERFDIIDEDDVIAVAKSVTKSNKDYDSKISNKEALRLDTLVPDSHVDMNDIME